MRTYLLIVTFLMVNFAGASFARDKVKALSDEDFALRASLPSSWVDKKGWVHWYDSELAAAQSRGAYTRNNYGPTSYTNNNYGATNYTTNNYGSSNGTINNYGDSNLTINNYGRGRTTVNDYGSSRTSVYRRR